MVSMQYEVRSREAAEGDVEHFKEEVQRVRCVSDSLKQFMRCSFQDQ